MGCKYNHKSLDMSKIREKSLKIWAKFLNPNTILKHLGKIPENLGKNSAQRCLTKGVRKGGGWGWG